MSTVSYAEPKPCWLTRESVYRIAESVAKQLDYMPGGSIETVLGKLGGKIEYRPIWKIEDSSSGSMQVHAEGDFDIYLPSHTSLSRDRFTIAHEIGHYVLHFLWARKKGQSVQNLKAKRYGSDRVEWEANWFAAAFLMPDEAFRKVYDDFAPDLTEVADRFGVSMKAAQVRAAALGLCE